MELFGLVRRPVAEPFMEPVNEISWAIPDDDYFISTMELVHQGLISRQEADQLIRGHYYQERLRKAQETIAEGVHNPQFSSFAINTHPAVRWADLPIRTLGGFTVEHWGPETLSRKTEDWLIRWGRR